MQLSPNMMTVNDSIKKNTGLISQSINNQNGISINVRKDIFKIKKQITTEKKKLVPIISEPLDDQFEIQSINKRTRNRTMVS